MQYRVYHDESKENGYWHGMLLVPENSRQGLVDGLERIRSVTGYSAPVHLKGLKEKTKSKYECIRMWLEWGVYSLMQTYKPVPAIQYKSNIGFEGSIFQEVLRVDAALKAKFIVVRVKDNHASMRPEWFRDNAAKIETTFRMGLKGGLNLFFSEREPVSICSIHFDGYKHYGRRVSRERIIGKLEDKLRPYCDISSTTIHDNTGNHEKPDSQSYEDCQLLQLTDLLIGAFRTLLGEAKNDIQKEASHSVNAFLLPARANKNSRWHKGLAISEYSLDENGWHFNAIEKQINNSQQLNLYSGGKAGCTPHPPPSPTGGEGRTTEAGAFS